MSAALWLGACEAQRARVALEDDGVDARLSSDDEDDSSGSDAGEVDASKMDAGKGDASSAGTGDGALREAGTEPGTTQDDAAGEQERDGGEPAASDGAAPAGDASDGNASSDAASSDGASSDAASSDAASSDGASSDAASSDASADSELDLGKGDGKDVITIGDSWMSLLTTGIQQSLVRASGQPYRTYGVAGTRLLNGQIPGQYDRAKQADADIATVVMTGGGNDLLLTSSGDDCDSAGPNCRAQIDKVGAALVQLWQRMADDGVKDVVYIEYSRGGDNEASVNYATETIRPMCEAAPLNCHWIDSDLIIMEALRSDGVHPTNAAYEKLGKAVFDLMVAEGMRR